MPWGTVLLYTNFNGLQWEYSIYHELLEIKNVEDQSVQGSAFEERGNWTAKGGLRLLLWMISIDTDVSVW